MRGMIRRIDLTERTIGFVDVPKLNGNSAALARILPLEREHEELLIQCHGRGNGVRYLLEWRGEEEPPEEVREALMAAGAIVPTCPPG